MDQKLKADFPIDWEEDQYVSRREFFKFLTLASGGLVAGSAAVALAAQGIGKAVAFAPKKVCSLQEALAAPSLRFRYPREQDLCLLVRRPNGSLAAFSQRCTHLSCPVDYDAARDRILCPCHNGAFSPEDGSVLQGPPPRPLPRIDLAVKDNDVWAVGVRRSDGE